MCLVQRVPRTNAELPLQDIANINADLLECKRRCGLVKAMLQRRAEEAEEASKEWHGRPTATVSAHPHLVAAKEHITQQLQGLHTDYNRLCSRRDTLISISEVRSAAFWAYDNL
jgi:hypothetical protein